ncbi:MAG: SDR family oxidoreductase [Anaerolineaceae bacterium]|nr:SDR family oxidoreductase [Anaerolineaceae bacterium]
MRLLVTGASGLLGLNLSLVAARQGMAVTGLVNSRSLQGVPFEVRQVNLLETDAAIQVIEASRPDAIIHCAAIASINAAEQQPELTHRLNAEVPGRLAAAARGWGVPFVHISSDAVFDGAKGDFTEADPTGPLSLYGRAKLAGEQAVSAANPDAIIARTVFYGWSLSGKRSLAEFFFNQLRAGEPMKGFTDLVFCPLYVEDLAQALLEMIEKGLSGVYHVVASDHLSKYDFGVRIARKFGLNSDLIEPVQAGNVDRGATRSLNLTLNTDKLQKALGHTLPGVDAGLSRLYDSWVEGYPQTLQGYRA